MGFQDLEELKRLYNELAMVHHLSSILTSTLRLEEVLEKTAEMTREIMQVEGCHLLLVQKVKEGLKLETAAHFGKVDLPEGIDFTKQGVSGLAVREKTVVIIDDAEKDPRTIKEVVRKVGPKSILAVPIIVREEALGVITVYHKITHYFNHRHAQFLTSLANQAGIAILNALLFRQMEEMANTDGLTGLYNHRFFHTSLEEQFRLLAGRQDESLSLLMMDLDNFKGYNDTYGHPAGDGLLRDFARLLMNMTGKNGVAARYGGDEFALILPGTGSGEANLAARQIEEAAGNFIFVNTGVSVSVGVASYPEIQEKNELIRLADQDLYRKKIQKKKICAG